MATTQDTEGARNRLPTESAEALDLLGPDAVVGQRPKSPPPDGAATVAAPDSASGSVATLLRQVLDGIPAGVFVLEARTALPIYANAAAIEMLGRGVAPAPPAELATTYAAFVAGTSQEYPTERMPIVRALRGERSEVDDMEIEREGQRVPLFVTGAPVHGAHGEVTHAAAVFLDDTARKAAEAHARGCQRELERSNAELEQFAYIASHDLQEPLRMVTAFTSLLKTRYGDQLDEEAVDFIGFACDGAERMARLVDGLLEFSRVGSGGTEGTWTDPGEAVDGAVASLRAAVEEAGAQIERGPLPPVLVDPVQLAQLFQNLIGNALKYRGDEPPRIQVKGFRDGSMVSFQVSDNGIGIAPEYRERVFRLFQRLHGRDRYQGTGIGLALCKRIVERHGGRIQVESAAPRGACFTFTLPAACESRHDDR